MNMAANPASRRLLRPMLLGLLLLIAPALALAHRVNVFAYAEGGTLHVEAYFQRSSPARNSRVEVRDADSGMVYLRGRTDDAGRFSFPVPAQAGTDRANLEILVNAGEGHQNRWTVKAAEYLPAAAGPGPAKAASPDGATSAATSGAAPAKAAPAPTPGAGPKARTRPVSQAGPEACPPPPDPAPVVEAAVEAAVERKIAPLREMMLASQEPGLKEIASGIGYLLGIAGLLAYARSLRHSRDRP